MTFHPDRRTSVILCIDDSPMRYNRLVKRARAQGLVTLVACRPEDVTFYLENYAIRGICLDHDMPYKDGVAFAHDIAHDYTPVVVTSLNPVGAARITDVLQDGGCLSLRIPCTHPNWEEQALAFFSGTYQETS